MHSISIKIPDELSSSLDEFAHKYERSKSFIIKKALSIYLENLADYEKGIQALEKFEESEDKKTYDLDEIAKELDI